MRYAIMINLDYESNGYDECHELWTLITQRMVEAGFRLEGRLFTIEMPPSEACEHARRIIEEVNRSLGSVDRDVFTYLKEFYGYDHTRTVNLLLPSSENFEIREGL